jgi:RHH-type transcriptional regulator, proline utilization regulon repressor / proline dehydrogenase / delta 1-pyrroline-5-carboxylate dehydrogenase
MPAMDLEDRTQRYGREIFARLNRHGPLPFTPSWFDDRLMNWTMNEEALKVQLFRFIDTLPLLHTPEEVATHLKEYLHEAGQQLPWYARWGARVMPTRGFLARAVASAARWNAEHMARRFIAGSNVAEALQAIARMRRQELAFTIDLLGEATITEVEADAVQKQYLDLIDGLARVVNTWPEVPLIDCDDRGRLPRVNVSVKLSALYSQFDPIDPEGTSRAVVRRLRPILHAARAQSAFVNFDMEQYAFKDVTLRIFGEVLGEPEFRDWPDVGIAIQAYLHDTEEDLRRLLSWTQERGTPVWVRLVKGAYWDYETIVAAQHGWPVPVFTHKWESDANFERCTRFLLEHHDWLRPAFGSHNVRSLAAAMASAEELGVPPRHVEFQMLYGMADEIKEAIVSMGRRVRIYTPYGQLLPGMAYLVRRLLENTSNESFLRASFRENVPEERLLMNPVRMAHDGAPKAEENGKVTPRVSGPIEEPFQNEPLTDFSKESNRRAMQQALERVRGEFGRTFLPIIDNEQQPTEQFLDSINPSHSKEIVGRIGRSTVEHAEGAIVAAQTAFPSWRDTPVQERAVYLFAIAREFRKRRFELAAWEVYECGKPWRESDADVAEAIDFCEYYGKAMLRLGLPQHRDMPGEDNEYFYEPRGVAVIIAPWNFPLAILCGMTTAALVAGNTVIMKPAEQSSIIGAQFMEAIRAAGLPPGVASFLPGVGEEIGPTLVNHPDVALIAFTGSLGVGLAINEQAARTPPSQHHVKRVIAEMGGKNAVIVDADADLDEAVRGVADSAFGYQGQKCSAGSRAIVLEPIYEQFLARLVEATRSLTVAPAEEPGCAVGPVIDEEAFNRIRRMIGKGKQEARLVYAGELGSLEGEGYYIAPHIFADVPEQAVIAQEEIFGPVLSVLRAANLDEALHIANGTKYALTGGIFSRSPKHIERVKREFRVGNLYVNRKITGALVNRQPFGGFRLSGIGSKAGGPDYLLQFLLPRAVTENTLRRGFAPTS